MAIIKTTGRAPDLVRLDTFQRITKIHWPKDHGEPESEVESEYTGWWVYNPVQTLTTYIWRADVHQWVVFSTRTFGFATLADAIRHNDASGPFTEGMADLILSTMNGWFAAYNGLGAYPAIEFEEPPFGNPANEYVAGVGLSSTGGDSSNGFGGGSTIVTFPYLTKASQPTYLKPYG
jgi:hypothetical protein